MVEIGSSFSTAMVPYFFCSFISLSSINKKILFFSSCKSRPNLNKYNFPKEIETKDLWDCLLTQLNYYKVYPILFPYNHI